MSDDGLLLYGVLVEMAHESWSPEWVTDDSEEVEREPDGLVTWHYRHCPFCALKANGQVVRFPDDANVQRILGPIAHQLEEMSQ